MQHDEHGSLSDRRVQGASPLDPLYPKVGVRQLQRFFPKVPEDDIARLSKERAASGRIRLEPARRRPHIRTMARERYIARCIEHWHVVLIGADGKETVMEITDSEESAKAEAARLDREAERT